ncbi:hypothetical protein CJD36_021925 [Flavipsychrobacter stenotrophus]|uniref:Uncharacterized protein n=1 Tax=Flavipsychrobacter stenotrophus TaxID=2077091 RepID=A0A2S7SQP4_9BACT|nr:hypothetical protein [Flavipsychrobacter stenotrophus]PQJ08925.1 hypothetical protein CJD36_021925 [Flavipsychrobacter stenotrophus]
MNDKLNIMPLNYSTIKLQQIRFLISELRNFNEGVEKSFEKATKDIDKEYSKLEKQYKGNEEALYNLADVYSDRYNETARVFPNHFRISAFNQIMSFALYQLTEICDLHSRITDAKYKVSDLKGSELEACKTYLKNSAGVDFSKLNTLWEKLNLAYKVRNIFVHQMGELETSAKNFKSIDKNLHDKGQIDYKYITKPKDAKSVLASWQTTSPIRMISVQSWCTKKLTDAHLTQ